MYKTELIKPRGPWRNNDDVEYATAEWADWYNCRRLYEYCGDMPPAELEAICWRTSPKLCDPVAVEHLTTSQATYSA